MSAVITRDQETRDAKAARDKADLERDWKPAGKLPVMDTSKDWHYRWIREKSNGFDDIANMNSRFAEGYRPVGVDDVPPDFLVLNEAKDRGLVGTGGLLLARISKRAAQQRIDAMEGRVREQGESIENDVFRQNSEHRKYTPVFRGQGHGISTVSAGRGKV